MTKKHNDHIYVIYIGILDIRTGQIIDNMEEYINNIAESINNGVDLDGQTIYLPEYSYNSRIECINPKYITDQDLINKHTELIKILNEKLIEQTKI